MDLEELVAIRSVAGSSPAECERAAEWVVRGFTDVGFADARTEQTSDGSLAVVGSRDCGDPDAPTVLLYAHYDVQPALDENAWHTPPFALTRGNGRWYGRGAADCKGNIVMHLTALRALDHLPVNLKIVVEGAEERGTDGLATLVRDKPELVHADAILVCDTGNAAVGHPAVTVSLRGMVNVVVTVRTMAAALHSGMFGGPAPDALAALIAVLATLRDDQGNTVVPGLDRDQQWLGEPYPVDRFRSDAGVLDDVTLLGDGGVADMLWARPAVTVLGIDCPPVTGSAAAIVPEASARLNLRIPPDVDAETAANALVDHLHASAPWGARVAVETEAVGTPFRTAQDGPAHRAMATAMLEAYGRPAVQLGQGGSIPLCTALAEASPDAELILMGVEEPQALIHAPNESVDPGEIARMALVEALFLSHYPRSQA
nr:dipeptidase [Kibdelosporangium sp. MJ126-NF4]CEL16288.1 Catalyzes the cleavage of p-aminobenzoyl-glutamate to p-aminobenzoate and glutamate, subunit A [Kibdelosporangium sp. MJ126-NF4]CTQ94211.1 Catalyzes the cleavage of p-aminobenzoyl-glutamate to p-aminobenzoate and glutamate, subunit A [Kibdelosporangium sp. MJ126-NF4]